MLDSFLNAMRALAESTRVRIVAVLLHGELTVTELTSILEQSQPRVSRHLKILTAAGLIERYQEGTWVFYRLSNHSLTDALNDCIPIDDRIIVNDLQRLEKLRAERREAAAEYFKQNARRWDQIRARYVSEESVEARLISMIGKRVFDQHIDLGTGTGRMIRLFAPFTGVAVGIDNSREMLAVARANLDSAKLRHCQVRFGDIRTLDVDNASVDFVTVHHVLHYLDEPAEVLHEAARILKPGGIILIVDLAPHDNELLRTEFAHRRLGFAESEIAGLIQEAGLECEAVESISDNAPVTGERAPLDVVIWAASHDGNNRIKKTYTGVL